MEDKLKTLKDLKEFDEEGCVYSETYEAKILKAEAVKDYKYYVEVCEDDNVADYIKWKNNLTEEDLMTNEEINSREHGEIGNN